MTSTVEWREVRDGTIEAQLGPEIIDAAINIILRQVNNGLTEEINRAAIEIIADKDTAGILTSHEIRNPRALVFRLIRSRIEECLKLIEPEQKPKVLDQTLEIKGLRFTTDFPESILEMNIEDIDWGFNVFGGGNAVSGRIKKIAKREGLITVRDYLVNLSSLADGREIGERMIIRIVQTLEDIEFRLPNNKFRKSRLNY